MLFARLGDHHHSVLADIGQADTLAAMGDFDEALRIYARARMRAERQSLPALLALVEESVALVELARGHYRPALAGLESARRRYEVLAMPQLLAVAEKQLADAYLELRLLPEASSLLGTAVAKFRDLELPDEQAWALNQQGRAQALLGQAGAGDAFAQAGEIFAAQGNQVGVASVALARAELALAGGDAPAALVWAAQAGTGFRAAAQADGCARADVMHAQAALMAGHIGQASAILDATLARAQVMGQLQVQVRCLTGQGLVALARGLPSAARDSFEGAIELFEEQRRALPGDEMRSAFLTDHLRPYQERLRMALSEGHGCEVLLQLDRFRARALDERLAEGPAAASPPGADQGRLRERLQWLYRRVQRLQDEGAPFAAPEQEMLRTEHELLEHARRQRLAAPSQPGQAGGGLDIAALQGALQEADALVEFGVVDDELFACVVRRDRVELVRRMASWSEVIEALRSMHFQLESLRHGAAPVRAHMAVLTLRAQARLARLQKLVWAPLTGVLAGCRRVLLVPHAQLASLPFAALPVGGLMLGQSHELAMAPSARAALRGLLRPPRPAVGAVVLAESSRLPHAGREAALVAGLFPGGRAFVDDQATLQTLRQHAGGADVLHLACHAQFRSDNPRFSALHLHDGALSVDLIETLALGPCTVVLSACESGLGETGNGDERIGLVRAFLVAGAARVVASLWPVDDEVTAAFMLRFYRHLVGGQGPAAALAGAQAETMVEHPHPSYWAAFAVLGGW